MAYTVFPVAAIAYPLEHTLEIDGIVNDFGAGYEQRVITDIARGPRANGEGSTATYVGRNRFRIGIPRLPHTTHPDESGNVLLDNSIYALWNFYKARFYNSSTGEVQWQAFYWYNPIENTTKTTWDGTTTTGRYLVRFAQPSLTRTQFIYCLASFNIELVEVVE